MNVWERKDPFTNIILYKDTSNVRHMQITKGNSLIV